MRDTSLNLKFLKRLQPENGVTEISDLTHNLGGIEDYENIIDGFSSFSDLFFVSFLPNEKWEQAKEKEGRLPRTKNEFVKGINYLKADFDIRSYIYEHENRVISNEELLEYKDRILREFDLDKHLHTYNAVVLSGNGIHIYWIGKTVEIEPRMYATISTKLYDIIKTIFYPDPHLRPDYACGNIGRLLRLPGSKNFKSKFGLPPMEVQIIEYKEEDSPLLEELSSIAEELVLQDELEISILKADMKHKCYASIGLVKNSSNTFDRINSLNIADLVCNHTGWELAKDGRNFISNRDGKYTGAYIIPEENVLVHTGTPHISDYFKVYSPFAFIMVHYADGDARKTFEIAEEMFPEVREDNPKFLSNIGLVENGADD